MKIVAIIQARLGSTRLPNKVLLPMPSDSNVSVLGRVIMAAHNAVMVDDVVVVTPDDEVAEEAINCGAYPEVIVQEERDVLNEYYTAAREHEADVIVRLTADCPLLTGGIIDDVVYEYIRNPVGYVYNHHDEDGEIGDGYDVEVFPMDALNMAWMLASGVDREHVGQWMKHNLEKTILPSVTLDGCSLNTEKDYQRINEIWRSRESVLKG